MDLNYFPIRRYGPAVVQGDRRASGAPLDGVDRSHDHSFFSSPFSFGSSFSLGGISSLAATGLGTYCLSRSPVLLASVRSTPCAAWSRARSSGSSTDAAVLAMASACGPVTNLPYA